jgi:hypothetical protein
MRSPLSIAIPAVHGCQSAVPIFIIFGEPLIEVILQGSDGKAVPIKRETAARHIVNLYRFIRLSFYYIFVIFGPWRRRAFFYLALLRTGVAAGRHYRLLPHVHDILAGGYSPLYYRLSFEHRPFRRPVQHRGFALGHLFIVEDCVLARDGKLLRRLFRYTVILVSGGL